MLEEQQARLEALALDPKFESADRGRINQEMNCTSRNPPGKDHAHERGREAAKGYGYALKFARSRFT